MAITLRIPKLTDSNVIKCLSRIRIAVKPEYNFKFFAHAPHKRIELPEEKPEDHAPLKYVLDLNSQVIGTFHLLDRHGREALAVRRVWDEVTDLVTIPDDWSSNADAQLQQVLPQLYVKLLSLAREELKVSDVEAALTGNNDNSWDRYRTAQTEVINSLQQATETLILRASEQNAELDRKRSERFEKLEADLRAQLDSERKELQEIHDQRLEALRAQEKALADKEAAFNTKESHYVARQKQTEQIEKIQSWLDSWSLTEGTRLKRRPIATAYLAALITTGALTLFTTWHSYALLKSTDELIKLAWWQWAGIWAKSVFPLAAFITFVIYYIRWSGEWARQHAEEEFRNRTRLIDIGRSSWLLEAVRDAQARNKEIPADLLRELSRNLFANSSGADTDIHPQAISDLLMQGLSSVRIKSVDGAEVEATRKNGR